MQSQETIQLYELLHGYQVTQAISTAAKLNIADLLQDSPKSCEELSKKTDFEEDKIYRLLRALASIGIFKEIAERVFDLTPKASLLISTSQDTLHAYAIRSGEESYLAWSKLSEGITNYCVPFAQFYNEGYFSYLENNDQASKRFNQAMVAHTRKDLADILSGYDFSKAKNIIDVGGGYGQLLRAILEQYPDTTGALFDRKGILDQAKQMYPGDPQQYSFIEGDFLQEVPSGGDLYLLKHILHDWNDEDALLILKNCRKAIDSAGRLLIIETVIPLGNTPHSSKWHDLHMLVLFGGKERSKKQINALLKSAGFLLSRVVPLKRSGLSELSIIEATPIKVSNSNPAVAPVS